MAFDDPSALPSVGSFAEALAANPDSLRFGAEIDSKYILEIKC